MQSAGFSIVACGEDGPAAGDLAEKWNARWDAHRASKSTGMSSPAPRVYPFGSLGEAFHRFKATKTWEQKKPRTREDWERGWKYIEPSFGDVLPRIVTLKHVDTWYATQLEKIGVREAHRAMKIWRALWRIAGAMKYCDRDGDPSLGIRRKTPAPRNAICSKGKRCGSSSAPGAWAIAGSRRRSRLPGTRCSRRWTCARSRARSCAGMRKDPCLQSRGRRPARPRSAP